VFSRSGFTDGYFTGERKDMFGTRQKEDVVAAKDVLSDLAHLYDNENPLLPVDFFFTCKAGEPIRLTAKTDAKEVTVTGAVPEAALHRPMTEESVAARLQKLGGTQYYVRDSRIVLDGGLIVSASALNGLRRAAVEALNEQEVPAKTALPYTPVSPRYKGGTPYFTARFTTAEQIPETHPFQRVFLPIDAADEDFLRHGAGVELPRGLFGAEDKLKTRLAHLKAIGVTMALASNLGAYRTAQALGFEMYGDFGLNVFNSESARQFASPLLSFELTLEQANRISADDTGIIAYGKLPLMLTRNCPVKNRIGCGNCRKQGTLTDRKGYKFPVKCSSYPCVEILNPLPLWLGDRLDEIHTDFVQFYFTDETREEVAAVIQGYREGRKPDYPYTRGLYYRGVK